MIEVSLSQGSVAEHQEAQTLTLLPDQKTLSWGFSHMKSDTPQYCWQAKYWYRDGSSKTIALHDDDGNKNVLEMNNIA